MSLSMQPPTVFPQMAPEQIHSLTPALEQALGTQLVRIETLFVSLRLASEAQHLPKLPRDASPAARVRTGTTDEQAARRRSLRERRANPRAPLHVQVTCFIGRDRIFYANAVDISLGGMYLESTETVAFGDEVTLMLRLPGVSGSLLLPATVRWHKPGGFGVQLGLLDARETHAINDYCSKAIDRASGRTT